MLFLYPMNKPQPERWPNELDALIAAPEHHKLLFENDSVRVLDTTVPRGEMTPVHTHCFASSLIVISWSDFIRYDAEGNVQLDSRSIGQTIPQYTALWSDPLVPHAVKNVGTNDLHIIRVEIKK